MFEIYNTDALLKISVNPMSEADLFEYIPSREKSLFKSEIKESIAYHFIYTKYYSLDEFRVGGELENYIFINNKIYNKPYVNLTFLGGLNKVVIFDSDDLANEYAKKMNNKYMSKKDQGLIFETQNKCIDENAY